MRSPHAPRRLPALLAAACVALAAPAGAADEGRVRQGQPLTELLERKGPAAKASERSGAEAQEPGSLATRLALWAAGIVAMGVLVFAIQSRRRARGTAPGEAGAVQVVGRALLSHRHAVYVLRVSNRRLVIGVSGDRMTALGAVDDGAPERPAAEKPERAPGAGPRGFSARPGDREAVASARAIDPAELLPYRKQMDRLRGLLREMRGGFGAEGSPGGP
ncbi:MAG: flagellar biosynthetic protein FliO [Planctomycetes bacterium]|nr:flagellar biosynthetic protein FliO [Planctomycetota bacterium]